MQMSVGAIVLLLGAFSCEARVTTEATPLGKVITMLEEMAAKGQKEKEEEEVKFAAFTQWCTGQTKVKSKEIEEGEENMEMQSATIQKADARIRGLTDRVYELEEDI